MCNLRYGYCIFLLLLQILPVLDLLWLLDFFFLSKGMYILYKVVCYL